MMRASLAPRPAQACTNSRPPSDTNSPRTSRAMLGQETAAIAMISLETEGERIATINRAKMKAGMVWKNSVMRISTASPNSAIRLRANRAKPAHMSNLHARVEHDVDHVDGEVDDHDQAG